MKLADEIGGSIQPSLIDRLVMAVDPRRGLKRMQARTMLAAAGFGGGYEGGRRERRGTKRWRPPAASADADILLDLPDLRSRSRDLARNVPIATGAIATKVTSVVGTGLQLQASIEPQALGITDEQADAMEREQEREWCAFCRTADFTRIQHLDEMAVLSYRSVAESGDNFIIRRYRKDVGDIYGTKLQILEADRVLNPNRVGDSDTVAGGVEIDGDGVPVAYHVTNKHPGGLRVAGLAWQRVAARTTEGATVVLHLYDRLRPEQTRGVPYLSPVVELVKQLGDYTDAEVKAAVLTSMVTWFIKTAMPEDPDDPKPVLGERDASLPSNEVKLGTGAMVELGMGEDVTAPSPNRPNPQFDPFFLAMTRMIGVALEIPQELLVKHFTASYSASRAALEMAWQFFRKERTWLARRYYQPIYEWMMEEAVATGRLNRPGFFEDPILRQAYCGANWIGPTRASIDPKKESDADIQDVEAGFKTGEQVCMERTGGQWERKHAQLVKETQMRREGGLLAAPAAGAPVAAQSGDAAGSSGSDYENEAQPAGSMAR